jgi:hypothetical protein
MEQRKQTAYGTPYPEQQAEFEAILQQLLQIHRVKTADYSPWNIRGVGEVGIAVRLWDKTARLLNLLGWDIETGTLRSAKEPKNEPLEDTLLDLASYAIIMLIYRRGKWGK